jgi:hypothetical protein
VRSFFTTTALTGLTAKNSLAVSPRYHCSFRGGVPHTFVRNPRGNIPIIKWEAAGNLSAKEGDLIPILSPIVYYLFILPFTLNDKASPKVRMTPFWNLLYF